MKPEDVNYIIYHYPCVDGFGSAFSAWLYFSTLFPDRNIIYHKAKIGSMPPEDILGRNVLICDFSYKKIYLDEMIKKTNNILILDHHKTSKQDLQDIPEKYKIFDMSQSGAMLTWKYFFPDVEPPMLIKYIQDNDIWTKKMENTEYFYSWFYTLPFEFEVYNKYLNNELLLKDMQEYGSKFNILNEYYVNESVNKACIKFMNIKGNYYLIAYTNASICKSEIGNQLITKYPLIDFASVYSISDYNDSTAFSLRSTNNHVDVSEISRLMGGGGHRNASGVYLPYITNTLSGNVLDTTLYKYLEIYTKSDDKKLTVGKLLLNEKNYNVIYCYCSGKLGGKLGSYLLQTKYIIEENTERKERKSFQIISTLLDSKEQNIIKDKINNDEKDEKIQLLISDLSIENSKKDEILKQPKEMIRYQITYIWTYDCIEDKTNIIVCFDKSLNEEEQIKLSILLKLDEKKQINISGKPLNNDLSSLINNHINNQ
jgi:oligoribonuclease NrnB/cAMP/cGMP phosphodiesterase (DHH superfamily)